MVEAQQDEAARRTVAGRPLTRNSARRRRAPAARSWPALAPGPDLKTAPRARARGDARAGHCRRSTSSSTRLCPLKRRGNAAVWLLLSPRRHAVAEGHRSYRRARRSALRPHTPAGSLQPLFAQINDSADILVLCGDLTDYGLARGGARAREGAQPAVKIPIVAVLGNHDFESGQQDGDRRRSSPTPASSTLDGDTTEIHGIGFAGIKGFAGGFGRRALGPWGEDIIKKFVHEAVDEALKLESALARLRNDDLIAPPALRADPGDRRRRAARIFPFLGCSRLEEPLTRFPVTAVFHGHAHHGRPKDARGRTFPSTTSRCR